MEVLTGSDPIVPRVRPLPLPLPPATPARLSSSQYAAGYIRGLIFEGALRAGDRIPQDDIARMLALSRIPVREAIIALEREGLLVTELNRGAYVASLDEQAILDQYEVYALVFAYAAERALDRAADRLLPALRELAERLEAAEEPVAVGEIGALFHRTVLDATASPRIPVVIRSMPALQPSTIFTFVPQAAAAQKAGIAAILAALEHGGRHEIAAAYAEHMRTMSSHVIAVFRERGLLT